MQKFNFKHPNIFIKIEFQGNSYDKEFLFIYSNEQGIKHLNEKLEHSFLFKDLFDVSEILRKMQDSLGRGFSSNSLTGINTGHWVHRQILSGSDQQKFNLRFNSWIKKLEQLVGEDNLFKVSISEKKLYEHVTCQLTAQDELMNYLETFRLHNNLIEKLPLKDFSSKKHKI